MPRPTRACDSQELPPWRKPKPRRWRGKRAIAVGEARRPFESARRAPTSPGGRGRVGAPAPTGRGVTLFPAAPAHRSEALRRRSGGGVDGCRGPAGSSSSPSRLAQPPPTPTPPRPPPPCPTPPPPPPPPATRLRRAGEGGARGRQV